MMNDLRALAESVLFRLERLEAHVRRHEICLVELSKDSSVLNRKVTAIDYETQANSFLEEEIPEEGARSAHQAVQRLSQTDA